MSDATTISALLKSTTLGPAWHGPSMMELLRDLTAAQAASHPVPGVHSIWEIVNHINVWQNYTLAVLHGHDVSSMDDKDDWPGPQKSRTDSDWQTAKRVLEVVGREIRETVVHFDDDRMRVTVPNSDFNIKVLLHGMVSHNLYHCGQIAMLRRSIEQSSTAELKLRAVAE